MDKYFLDFEPHATVTLRVADGVFESIFVHYNGFVRGGVGETLLKHYTNTEKIAKLLDLGDCATIGSEPVGFWDGLLGGVDDKCQAFKMSSKYKGGRDKRCLSSVSEVVKLWPRVKHHYVFQDGKWCEFNRKTGALTTLSL